MTNSEVGNMTQLYGEDPLRGFWLTENDALGITLNKKQFIEEDVLKQLELGNFEIIVHAMSDRAINSLGQKGGRLSFTIPSAMFAKTVHSSEVDNQLEMRPTLSDLLTQRAPGKNIRISLKNDLTDTQKIKAIKDLSKKPLIIRLVYSEQPSTMRLAFKLHLPDCWLVDQKA